MKTFSHALTIAAAFFCASAGAITFTNDSSIGVGNTNYDGLDVVVTNCTLTVDGAHSFASLRVAAGGTVTHSSSSTGTISSSFTITNESQVLVDTNPVSLNFPNVVATSVVVTDQTGTNIYTNLSDYLLTNAGNLTQLQRTTNSTLPDGGTVLVTYTAQSASVPVGLNLTVAGNVQVDPGGAINADGRGWIGGLGTGAGHSAGNPMDGSGGGYGGNGGNSSSNAAGGIAYGSYTQPTSLGSGGGAGVDGLGGSGGGVINITAGGSLIINGSISASGASGTNTRSGGGSGGSILLTSSSMAGSGVILADGGNGEPDHGGGGGGGRISLQYATSIFFGTTNAYGGAGAVAGGAGTIYTRITNGAGLVVFDNGGRHGANTVIAISDTSVNIIIGNGATVIPSAAWIVLNLTVNSNGLLSTLPLSTLAVTANGVVNVKAGGGIVADGDGYASGLGSGPGHGANVGQLHAGGGGGYGGSGSTGLTNALGGTTYGSMSGPTDYGSGGGFVPLYSTGGGGGGAIRITSLKSIIQVDGVLSANGGNGSGSGGGGGSGGSIWLTGGTLLGSGTISANGGAGANSIGAGGGGGRIAINPDTDSFGGTISSFGGGGSGWGGAGTVWIQFSGQNSQLVLDNNGHFSTNTPVTSLGVTDLTVRNGAIASSSFNVSFANLLIKSNGWIGPVFSQGSVAPTLSFSFTASATIQPGGGILADFAGSAPGANSGQGHIATVGGTNYGSGGGHGGPGGNSSGNFAVGGTTYDSATGPSIAGSGGGSGTGSPGGNGGGVVRLSVTGTLEMDGIVTANGAAGSGAAGGGGSGGSIWISAGTFSGAGAIVANGGNGADSSGGGGGGGLVFVSCNNNLFNGQMSAYGGGGANWGGTGPTTILVTGKNTQFVLDGGGRPGVPTPLSVSGSTDIILRNGAVALLGTTLSGGNLSIASNSWLLVSNSPGYVGSISMTSATIAAGGGIFADSTGYGGNSGSAPGHGSSTSPSYACSGAGHAGLGGNGAGNVVLGGNNYDTTTSPSQTGSGGGSQSPYSVGGNGGGGMSLSINGLLQLNGIISANGGNGSGAGGGGGSGGCIRITASTFAGAGSISANGGSGANAVGGGGSGGCIAIFPVVNLFAGTISAYGGGGANWGAAGTIYIQGTDKPVQLILDNGGHAGAGTAIQSIAQANLSLSNGAVGFQQAPAQTFASLVIGSNAWIIPNPISGNQYAGLVTLTISGNATLLPGGGIMTDKTGFATGAGIGAGHADNVSPFYPCTGGGYGGYGATDAQGSAGGAVYGSVIAPTIFGSGGGSVSPNSIGGAGGGSIQLTVSGTLVNAGTISSDGDDGSGSGGGGGSGGSVLLTVGTFTGNGLISASGGFGADSVGGGGGGGRIAINYTVDNFAGSLAAYGGGGYSYGGSGTIYLKSSSQPVGQVVLDNGSQTGNSTPLSTNLGLPPKPFNLTIGDGAIASPLTNSGFPVLSNLTINAGGVLTGVSSQSTIDLVVFNNVDVAAGGTLALDGEGYSQATGPGAGNSSSGFGSGAGYGATGGASATTFGGAPYGSVNQPADFGSGGGFGSGPLTAGSAGGGALHLSVGGVLTVDGQVTARGGYGVQDNSGGGSGGSIWVVAGTLAGGGELSADGGEGELYGGGSGAGGRIAIYSRANVFSGTASAFGGAGDSSGGDGTVVISNSVPALQVVSMSPNGILTNSVAAVILNFNEAPNSNSVVAGAITLLTPTGLYSNALGVSMLSSTSYQVTFLPQTNSGGYMFNLASSVTDLYGRGLNPAFTGGFTILLPGSNLSPAVAPSTDGTNFTLNWQGMQGVNYQIYTSTDLAAWSALGAIVTGSNGSMQVVVSTNLLSAQYFCVQGVH